jgi:hypothetical protein
MKPGKRSVSLAQQAFALQRVFPSAVIGLTPTKLRWTGTLTPTPLARVYTVRVEYALRKLPRVLVLDPPLVPDEGSRPHVYTDGSLCLHEAHEWRPSMLIVDSIVPWTSEWLAHYELWKWSGQWHGDEEAAEAGPGGTATDELDLTAAD